MFLVTAPCLQKKIPRRAGAEILKKTLKTACFRHTGKRLKIQQNLSQESECEAFAVSVAESLNVEDEFLHYPSIGNSISP